MCIRDRYITLAIIHFAIFASIYVENIFSVFLVADLMAVCLVFPAFYKMKSKAKDAFLLIPFVLSMFSVFIYRYIFVDLSANPGGVFIPTDLYGLADLNTFLVGFLTSTLITLAYNKVSK